MSNLTEEQQIEQLKDWWKDNGTPLLIGAALGISGFFGWKYWNEQQVEQQSTASDHYVALNKQIEAKNIDQQAKLAAAIKKDYANTAYAALSAFHLAKLAVEKGDLDGAVSELQWVIDKNIAQDMAAIAKIRIARIEISRGQPQAAIQWLDFTEDSGFYELANLLKGNAYLRLAKSAEALEAYQLAVAKSQTTSNHPSLKLIIDDMLAPQIEPLEEPLKGQPDTAIKTSEPAASSSSEEHTTSAKNEASE